MWSLNGKKKIATRYCQVSLVLCVIVLDFLLVYKQVLTLEVNRFRSFWRTVMFVDWISSEWNNFGSIKSQEFCIVIWILKESKCKLYTICFSVRRSCTICCSVKSWKCVIRIEMFKVIWNWLTNSTAKYERDVFDTQIPLKIVASPFKWITEREIRLECKPNNNSIYRHCSFRNLSQVDAHNLKFPNTIPNKHLNNI